MKHQIFLALAFMLIGLCALCICNTRCVSYASGVPLNPDPLVAGSPALTTAASLDSNDVTSYSYDFTILGKTYTAFVVTNSEVSDISMSQSGLGIQFQANVPSGTTGFFNVTVPTIVLGADIVVFQDGVLLTKDVSYSMVSNGTDYLFHLEYVGGTHIFVIEAAPYNTNTPTASPPPNQSGFPSGTVVAIAAIGGIAAASAVLLYAFKGAIFHKAGDLAAKGAVNAAKSPAGGGGGGSANLAVGANVAVYPHPEVMLTFGQVKVAGVVTAIPLLAYPALPRGIKFRGAVFDVKTTAVFTGLALVGLVFDGENMSEKEKKKLRVYRNDLKENSVWEDVTSSIDTKNNIVYGATDHFSLFGVR
jgi:hypothetical protein